MRLTWILSIAVCLSTASCEDDDVDYLTDHLMVQAIHKEHIRIQQGIASGDYTTGVRKEVCYPDIGCFSKDKDAPFDFLDVFPESPSTIKTTFSLFTNKNKDNPQQLSYTDRETLTTGLLDPQLPLALISHGLNENGGKNWIRNMKNSLLRKGYGSVIVVDWGNGAPLLAYGQAMANSELVGRQAALILELLHKTRGLRIDNVHLLGYSLGAHLCGFVGKNLQARLGQKVNRITGLDPAGPNFEDAGTKTHLSLNDATYVDVIHTSAGTRGIVLGDLGIIKAIGHVDYYPNEGRSQPGCGWLDITCSHRRANELYIVSLADSSCKFPSFPCPGGRDDMSKGKCTTCGQEGCGDLGFNSHLSPAKGTHYLRTTGTSPYC